MSKTRECQKEDLPIEQTVELEDKVLTVEYWRERFALAAKRFKSITEVAEVLGEKDKIFFGPKGYLRVKSANDRRASLQITAKAVRLMEQLKPQ